MLQIREVISGTHLRLCRDLVEARRVFGTLCKFA